jgi:hypothetical protein
MPIDSQKKIPFVNVRSVLAAESCKEKSNRQTLRNILDKPSFQRSDGPIHTFNKKVLFRWDILPSVVEEDSSQFLKDYSHPPPPPPEQFGGGGRGGGGIVSGG